MNDDNELENAESLEEKTITLPSCDPNDPTYQAKLDLLASLASDAKDMLKHVDQYRQRELSIALIVFAGLIGFSVTLNEIAALLVYLILTITMSFLARHDRSLHKSSHGWRNSWVQLRHHTNFAVKNPGETVDIQVYYKSYEEKAELWALVPKLYYGFVLIAFLLFICCAFYANTERIFPFLTINAKP